MISIVIPLYNKEKYIKKTLDSVLKQTYSDYEIIIVDDGSTDGGVDVVRTYTNSSIKLIQQANKGVSAARNTGIINAKYDYIAFIDADDYWAPTFLEKMIEIINYYPEISIYSSKYAYIKNNKVEEKTDFFSSNEKYILFDLIGECCSKARFPINASSVIIKKDSIVNAGYFDERIKVFEDYDLFVRIALFSKVAYLNGEPLSFYNLDVPAESKPRGKLPPLEYNWVCYMDKYNYLLDTHENLKILLDRSILNQMIKYRRLRKYDKEVKNLLSKVKKENYRYKYELLYKLPIFCGDVLLYIYSFISRKLNYLSNRKLITK